MTHRRPLYHGPSLSEGSRLPWQRANKRRVVVPKDPAPTGILEEPSPWRRLFGEGATVDKFFRGNVTAPSLSRLYNAQTKERIDVVVAAANRWLAGRPTIKTCARPATRRRAVASVHRRMAEGSLAGMVAEKVEAGRLVFVDECGTHTSLAPLYGWQRKNCPGFEASRPGQVFSPVRYSRASVRSQPQRRDGRGRSLRAGGPFGAVYHRTRLVQQRERSEGTAPQF